MKISKQLTSLGVALALTAVAGCAPQGSTMEDGMVHGSMSASQMVSAWPEVSRMAAMSMMEKYGQPDEMTSSMLVWHDNGPWKRTIVYRQEIQHNFPMPHKDVLEQFVDYDVPVEMFDDLAMYDGSVIVEQTKGEISARCDKEAANFLAINLANDIVTGQLTVDEARHMYAEQMMAMMNGEPAPETQGFTFSLPQGNTDDPDQPAPMFRGM